MATLSQQAVQELTTLANVKRATGYQDADDFQNHIDTEIDTEEGVVNYAYVTNNDLSLWCPPMSTNSKQITFGLNDYCWYSHTDSSYTGRNTWEVADTASQWHFNRLEMYTQKLHNEHLSGEFVLGTSNVNSSGIFKYVPNLSGELITGNDIPIIKIQEFKPNVIKLSRKIDLVSRIFFASNRLGDQLATAIQTYNNKQAQLSGTAVSGESSAETSAIQASPDEVYVQAQEIVETAAYSRQFWLDKITSIATGLNIPSVIHSTTLYNYNTANSIYRQFLDGQYMNSYTLPLVNEPTYLESDGSTAWSLPNALESIFGAEQGELLGSIAGFVSTFTGSNNIDIPLTLNWTPPGSNASSYPAINIEFNLFNRTFDDFARNFRFINTLVPGNMWIQNGLYQTASTLYDVEIPGRTHLFWCTGNFSVTYEGKVRAYRPSKDITTVNILTKSLYDAQPAFPNKPNIPTKNRLPKNLISYEHNINSIPLTVDANEKLADSNVKIGASAQAMLIYNNIKSFAIPNRDDATVWLRTTKNTGTETTYDLYTNRPEDYKSQFGGEYVTSNIFTFADQGPMTPGSYPRYPETIPDIYHVKIELQSLLPNNLTTYLMGIINPHTNKHTTGERNTSLVPSIIKSIDKALTEYLNKLNKNNTAKSQ